MVTIYADILFAINFSMDFLSLFLCAMILHRKIGRKRIVLASLLGALYGVLDVILIKNQLISLLTCVLTSIIMCLIVFTSKSFKRLIVALIMYWGVSAGLGGLMSLLYSLLNTVFYDLIKNYSQSSAYNGARFFVIASITAIISMVFSRIFTSKKDIKSTEIIIEYDKKRFVINALCDSGNILSEPISGKPVVIVSNRSKIGKIISEKEDKNKRYIPYKDVHGKGIIKGVLPEKIIINKNIVDAVVAPVDNTDFGGYEALVPISLV